MKPSLLLLGIFLSLGVAASTCNAQNLLLDVQNKGAGGAVHSTQTAGAGLNQQGNQTSASGSSSTQSHSTTLHISIRSQDKTPDQAQVEWYFFAKNEKNYHVSKEYVLDSGNKTISLQPTGVEEFDASSKVVKTTRSSSVSVTQPNPGQAGQAPQITSTQSQGGTKITGWVVRLLVNGKVIDAKGSEFKYEDAAKDPDKFAALKAGKEVQ